MLAKIHGTVESKCTNSLTIRVHGLSGQEIGLCFEVLLSSSELVLIQEKQAIELLTYFAHESFCLYGFVDAAQKELFMSLLKVSGVGPKSALAITSNINPEQLQNYINQEDATSLAKVPGIGKKTAQRMIVELKDSKFIGGGTNHSQRETLAALMALGFSEMIAHQKLALALKKTSSQKPEILLKLALNG